MSSGDSWFAVPPGRSARKSGSAAGWLSLALAFGSVLYVLRAAAVMTGRELLTPGAVEMARWHVGLTIERTFPFSLLVAAVAATTGLLLASRPFLATLLCSALFGVGLSGWAIDGARHVPNPLDARGRAMLFQQAVVAVGLGYLLLRACRRIRNQGARTEAGTRRWILAASILLSLAVPATAWAVCRRSPPVRPVRERVAELLSRPSAWEIVRSRPDAPPRAGFLAPSLDAGIDGAELPSLIMPPPCEIRISIPRVPGVLHLRASAGVDRRFFWQLEHAPTDTSASFEILVNGEARFSAVFPARGGDDLRAWRHAGGDEGLPVAAGDTVTLRTSLSPPDAEVVGNLGLLSGFGNLELDRTEKRPCRPADREHPNVLLVVMDTLRADELGCYGGAQGATPRLDALAERGILFERAYATSSWTWPSTTSILTGLIPEVHGVLDDTSCYLAASIDTLAEALEREDYATAAFACNPLLDPVKNFDQGFETYDYTREMRKSEEVLPRITEWIGDHADARFFLYVHLVDTHEPVRPHAEDLARVGVPASPPPGSPDRPAIEGRTALLRGDGLTSTGETNPDLVIPPDRQRWLRQMYSAAVSTADRHVGTVLGMLKEHGLEEKTLVAFTSDHGEELFDHGFIGHDHTLYQELVHVPMILAGPGIPRGRRVATPISNRHLAWTLARRSGAVLPGLVDPVDLAAAERLEPRKVYFSTEHGWWWNDHRTTILGVEEWPFVLHLFPQALPFGVPKETDPGKGLIHLYDLETDPHEKKDLSRDRPEIAESLERALLEHRRVNTLNRPIAIPGSGDATKELLRRLGYAGDEDSDKDR